MRPAAVPRVVRRPPGDPSPLPPELHPVLRRLYAARGVTDPRELDYTLRRLPDGRALGGIGRAAALLQRALEEGWRILVVGDFDADGATSTALALRGLRAMGAAQVDYLVPNRFEFGYGLTPGLVGVARRFAPDLILTVDNGIAAHAGVEAARNEGIRVLITDHHLPGPTLPPADAMVNPRLPGEAFPGRHLAGVGVLFYLLAALRTRLRAGGWFDHKGLEEPNLAQWLDLVSLGTVADVVHLDALNRLLVAQGIRRIRSGRCVPGITALLQAAGRNPALATAQDLGFAAGPRVNAAGRLEDISLGIECLLSDDPGRARELAGLLDGINRQRREIEGEMQRQALAVVEQWQARPGGLPPALVIHDPQWHQGVVGLLAARLKERLHRPVIALAGAGQGELKGSGRSIPGFHIRDALALVESRHPGLIGQFGGHAMAAGLTLPAASLSAFRQAFEAVAEEWLGPVPAEAVLESDGPLSAEELSLETARALRDGGPWGQGFPPPLFDGAFVLVDRRVVGEHHLKLRLQVAGGEEVLEAIAFRQGGLCEQLEPGATLEVAYRLEVNDWNGRERPQLVVEQITSHRRDTEDTEKFRTWLE